MSRDFCQACSFIKHGVKTRKSIPHTCNLAEKNYVTLLAFDELDARIFWKDEQIDKIYFARLPIESIERYKKESSQSEVESALTTLEFKKYDKTFLNLDKMKDFCKERYIAENKKIGRETYNVTDEDVKKFISVMDKNQLLAFIKELNSKRTDHKFDGLIEFIKLNELYDENDENMKFKEV